MFLDGAGRVLSVNEVAGAALGLDPARAVGRGLAEDVPTLAAWMPLLRRVIDTQAPIADLEVPGRTSWRATLHPMPASAGAPAPGVLLLLEDHSPTQLLQHSLSRYELVTRATHEAIWEWDVVTEQSWWNDHQYELFGYRRGEVEPSFEAWAARIHPEDRERVVGGFLSSVDSERSSWSESYRVTRRDGSIRHVIDRGTIERDASGKARRMIGAMSDVTETLAVEQALRESESQFRQIAETIRDAFWLATPSAGRAIYVSPAWETIWGRSRQVIMDDLSVLFETFHPDDRARVTAAILSCPERYDETYRIVRPDGSIAWIYDRGFPIRDADGNIVRFAGLATDITEKRQLEEQLRHSNKLESIGRLAGGLAHDFNNMLTVILTSSERAEIHGAAQRAAELTHQLLLFARQQEVAPSVVDINQLALRIEWMLRRLLGEQIELALKLSPQAVSVWADAGQLEQVLVNLAVNARDAMPRGGTLTIETALVTVRRGTTSGWDVPAGDYASLSVSDCGEGMSAEVIAHIFEPFYTTKAPGHGTGLGLATCYGIIKKAGGDIHVASEPGRGTAFQILLPAVATKAPRVAVTALEEPPGGNETILLVDDEIRLRTVASRVLRDAGYEVISAASGVEALTLAAAHQGCIDLLLTDVIMPQMNGVELAARLQSHRSVVRILYSSGYANDSPLPLPARPGEGVGFLAKPYPLDTLLRMVRAVLDG